MVSSHTLHLHSRTKVNLNLLQPCTKKEPASIIKEKGDYTIEELNTQNSKSGNHLHCGSSDSNLDRGGADVFFTSPNREHGYHKIQVGKTASNYTCGLITIKSAIFSKSIPESSGIIIFTDSRSTLQDIQKGKCRISHNPIHR
ncbi:hypothetical protein TNCV_4675761 [Trichonephila clavipes]|nr:hypothetical protein TNCV_4675761 [Trichonephila clavipes]